MSGNPATRCIGIAAVALWAATLAAFWPGYSLYDSVAQYRQVTSGVIDDWHPPVMVALWRVLHLTGGGAGPMLALQLGGWWLGLGLIAAGLARRGQVRGGVGILCIGLLPPLLGWQVAVLKDAQLAGALLAATGLVAWWRLRDRSVPWPARVGVASLLVYAALVRANGIFAVAPLVAGLTVGASAWRRVCLAAVLIVAALVVAGPIDHGLFGAARSGVERTQATYDLAGIAVRVPAGSVPGLTPAERAAIVAKSCSSAYFWDALGDDSRCGGDLAPMRQVAPPLLYRDLAAAAVAHPLAYLSHRLAHLNSTERWLVPSGWPGAVPPVGSEPNTVGLADPGAVARAWQRFAGLVVGMPLGWPVCWVVVALGALLAARPLAWGPRSLAVALAASALTLEASFAVVSIASDLRYHLWPMAASALAVLLVLAEARPVPRVWRPVAILLTLVIVAGTIARATLPTPPQTYAAMLRWG